MTIERRAGRTVAVLFLAQMTGSALLNFRLEAPLFGPPGFLTSAAPHALQLGASVVVGLALGALFTAVTIAIFPIVRARSQTLALWLFALGIVCLALAAVEHASVMAMVSLSQAYAAAAVEARAPFEALRGVVAATRNWLHDIARLLDAATLLAFYVTLWRLTLVPRAFAVLGLAAGVLQIAGIGVAFFGRPVMFPLLAPMGLAQLALCSWLWTTGFTRRTAAAA